MTEEDVVPVWLRPPPPPPHRPAPPPYMLPGGGGVCRPPCSAHGHLLRLPTEHVTDVGGQPAPSIVPSHARGSWWLLVVSLSLVHPAPRPSYTHVCSLVFPSLYASQRVTRRQLIVMSWATLPLFLPTPTPPPPAPPSWCPSPPSPTRLLGDERPPTPAARSEVVLVYAAVIIIKLTIHSYYVETLKIYQAKIMCYFNLILFGHFSEKWRAETKRFWQVKFAWFGGSHVRNASFCIR